MKRVILALALLVSIPAYSADFAYDGFARVYALKAPVEIRETPALDMKHTASPFASIEECQARVTADQPQLAQALLTQYGLVEGIDFEIRSVCELAGNPA